MLIDSLESPTHKSDFEKELIKSYFVLDESQRLINAYESMMKRTESKLSEISLTSCLEDSSPEIIEKLNTILRKLDNQKRDILNKLIGLDLNFDTLDTGLQNLKKQLDSFDQQLPSIQDSVDSVLVFSRAHKTEIETVGNSLADLSTWMKHQYVQAQKEKSELLDQLRTNLEWSIRNLPTTGERCRILRDRDPSDGRKYHHYYLEVQLDLSMAMRYRKLLEDEGLTWDPEIQIHGVWDANGAELDRIPTDKNVSGIEEVDGVKTREKKKLFIPRSNYHQLFFTTNKKNHRHQPF